jgi:hypothetical protein
MSEEYTLMQYDNERLKKDIAYWRQMAASTMQLQQEMETMRQTMLELKAENEDYLRLNDRIWATTKAWILEDSAIISKQDSQIKFLVEKVKTLEKNKES